MIRVSIRGVSYMTDFAKGIRKVGEALSAVISAEVTANAQAEREQE